MAGSNLRQARSPSPPKMTRTFGCGMSDLAPLSVRGVSFEVAGLAVVMNYLRQCYSGARCQRARSIRGRLATCPTFYSGAMPFFQEMEILIANENHFRHAQEQAGADDAGDGADFVLEVRRSGDGSDRAVEDVVAVVRKIGPAVAFVEYRLATEPGQALAAQRQGERHNLHRQLAPFTQHLDRLARPHEDNELPGGCGHDFLADQGAAVA